MAFPYFPVFVILLLSYMFASRWARTDPRLLVGFGLALLLGSATAAAGFGYTAADSFAEFAPVLLLGGLVLMILEIRYPVGGRSSAG